MSQRQSSALRSVRDNTHAARCYPLPKRSVKFKNFDISSTFKAQSKFHNGTNKRPRKINIKKRFRKGLKKTPFPQGSKVKEWFPVLWTYGQCTAVRGRTWVSPSCPSRSYLTLSCCGKPALRNLHFIQNLFLGLTL